MDPKLTVAYNLVFLEQYYELGPQQAPSLFENEEIRVGSDGRLYRNVGKLACLERLEKEGVRLRRAPRENLVSKIEVVYNAIMPIVQCIAATAVALFPGKAATSVNRDKERWNLEELTAERQWQRLNAAEVSWKPYLDFIHAQVAPSTLKLDRQIIHAVSRKLAWSKAITQIRQRAQRQLTLLALCLVDLRNALALVGPDAGLTQDLGQIVETAHRQVLAFPLAELAALADPAASQATQ